MNRNLRKGGSSLLTPRGTVAQNPAYAGPSGDVGGLALGRPAAGGFESLPCSIPGRVGEPRHQFRRRGPRWPSHALPGFRRKGGAPFSGQLPRLSGRGLFEVTKMTIETYEHHGRSVSVKSAFKGRHREICLCYDCARFRPESEDHCPMAATLFNFTRSCGGTAIRSECPDFSAK